ncbi:MAG: twin-arginine translocase TatA/TatE family subunit [Anaerolineales bacterium]|nr:twin-arginine translocase TatA/TatE family subunit [Anaerolineales bacterium]
MEILGIGMPELIFIVVIALLILGPKDMQKAGKTIGRFLRDLTRSDGWKIFQQTSRGFRDLPTRLIRDANMDLAKLNGEIKEAVQPTKQPADARPQAQPYQAQPYAATSPKEAPAAKAESAPESETQNDA